MSSVDFDIWWKALMAVPETREQLDWWADADGRFSRWDRLRRVFGDKSEHPGFYKRHWEVHLVTALWENFTLFRPSKIVHKLYEILKWDLDRPATDLCWSYLFNLKDKSRILDLVLHVRFDNRDEILVGEAKRSGCEFDDKKDLHHEVIHRREFRDAQERRYFLLGNGEIPADWLQHGHSLMTWPNLRQAQLDLCKTIEGENDDIKSLIRGLIDAQFAAHEIGPPGTVDCHKVLLQRVDASYDEIQESRHGNFVLSAVQHLRALDRELDLDPPFACLQREYSEDQIEGYDGDMNTINQRPYWKLPARPKK
jgi:hypothetical protein